MSESKPIIELKNIHKMFPGVYALKNINFSVMSGEVHALVGENGAGKSTLIKIMSGAYKADNGHYFIDGELANVNTPYDAIKKGIGVVYQELNLAENMTVAENIFFGRLPVTHMGVVNYKEMNNCAEKLLDEVGVKIDPKIKLNMLTIAKQQLVEIAKVMSNSPKVIIMDEPTSALSLTEIKNLYQVIERLKSSNVGIIYVSHKMDEIFKLSDRITIMRDGEWIDTVKTKNINEEEIIKMMVGREIVDLYPRDFCNPKEVILDVDNLSTDYVKNISFYVRAGEIIGFSGLMGSGRTEVARAVYGVDRKKSGKITVCGKSVPNNSTKKAKEYGIGMVPENRKKDGIFAGLSVLHNLTISDLKQFKKFISINKQSEKLKTYSMIKQLSIKTPNSSQKIVNLSGGNQQKVIVARWLIKNDLKVLIIDEPTRGVDIGAKSEIYAIMNELAKQGLAVVIMSSEMPELMSMCDRIYIMKCARLTAEFARHEFSQEKLLYAAIN